VNSGTKVLVTGGFGYVGGAVVRRLEQDGIDYLSVDRRYPRSKANTVAIDLRDCAATAALIGEYKPDILVHCGTNSAIAYRDSFVQAFRGDAGATSNILEALAGLRGCRLIYFSSSYCYSGLPRSEMVSETTPLLPSHNFGVSKAFFEQLVRRSHPNTVVFRLSSVFGPGNAMYPNSVFQMATECLGTGKVTVWGTGSRNMQYVYIDDVVSYIVAAPVLAPGLYNLGGDEYLSIADSAKMIAEILGAELIFLPDKREGETLPFMLTDELKRSAGNHFIPFTTALSQYLKSLAPQGRLAGQLHLGES
jgi:nucleoside-diphosphate-sugar epimerase